MSNTANDLVFEEINQDLPERIKRKHRHNDKFSLSQCRTSSPEKQTFDLSLNKSIRQYVSDQNSLQLKEGVPGWVKNREVPPQNEIRLTNGASVILPANKVDKAFKSTQSYLKTHYMLMREDAVTPLREAVARYLRDSNVQDDKNITIYTKVHVSGFTLTEKGIATRLKFCTERAAKRVLWSSSQRLRSDSMVALFPLTDNVSNVCLIATIAARPLKLLELSPPEVDVFFASPTDIRIDPQIEYVMLESRQGYFEAYRHTLKAFQKLSIESFGLASHVLGKDVNLDPPQYLTTNSMRNLNAIYKDSAESQHQQANIDILTSWPDHSDHTNLDRSQLEALRHILTKKLAIIQGPPGTGKTHVSKLAIQVMTENRAKTDPPIIIAAQTNHAVDQLLNHISAFCPDYIRLGGRSTNADVRERALYEVRKQDRIPNIPGSLFGQARQKLSKLQAKCRKLLEEFNETMALNSIDTLTDLKILTPAQYQSLIVPLQELVQVNDASQNPLELWIGRTFLPFEVRYSEDLFGFQEVEEDLEWEQLQEVEAEHGIRDEEDIESLKGRYLDVKDNWYVPRPSVRNLELAKRLLDTREDLYNIQERMREAVYFVMKEKAKEHHLNVLQQHANEYDQVVQELKTGKWERDAVYLSRAKIIGMTTSGLSKYRPLIASLNPKIVLIEEAAEVIEGPITAACMPSVEHLILVGDHQQLQGRCSSKELEGEPFYLNISMFERLLNVGMPFKTLAMQRRMNPEIRQLISGLYPQLRDHESVMRRPQLPLWGTGPLRSYFFHHTWAESKDESFSTYNEEEAQMVAKFYRHLLRHNVPASAITILTCYNGQRKKILKALRSDHETNQTYTNVKTVDSYQGEENDIIILSLVRSHSLGFLEVTNRICVALSRARYGLYLFGNGTLLAKGSSLWSDVIRIMSESDPSRFGIKLPLVCIKHNRRVHVQCANDFDGNEGGCNIPCSTLLSCGHTCDRTCHPLSHERHQCRQPCAKTMACNHKCAMPCNENCRCSQGCRPVTSMGSTQVKAGTIEIGGRGHAPLDPTTPEWQPTVTSEGKFTFSPVKVTSVENTDASFIEADLLDLSPTDHEVNHDTTTRLNRKRFMEHYKPQPPRGPNITHTSSTNNATANNNETGGATIPNLMD